MWVSVFWLRWKENVRVRFTQLEKYVSSSEIMLNNENDIQNFKLGKGIHTWGCHFRLGVILSFSGPGRSLLMCYCWESVRAFAFHQEKKYGFSACLLFQWCIYTFIPLHLTRSRWFPVLTHSSVPGCYPAQCVAQSHVLCLTRVSPWLLYFCPLG